MTFTSNDDGLVDFYEDEERPPLRPNNNTVSQYERYNPSEVVTVQDAEQKMAIINELSPYIRQNPELLLQLSQSGLDPVELARSVTAIDGLVRSDQLRTTMAYLSDTEQRALFNQLSFDQQTGLAAVGYAPPQEDASWLVKGIGVAGEVLGFKPVEMVWNVTGRPLMGGLQLIGDITARSYRTIRSLDSWSQTAALAAGVAAGIAAVAAAPVTFGGSLAAYGGTMAALGAGAFIGTSAATTTAAAIETVKAIGPNSNQFIDGWQRTGNGEKYWTADAEARARQLLEHDSIVALAKDIATDLDPYAVAEQFAGVRDSLDPNTMTESAINIALQYADFGTVEFQAIAQQLSGLMANADFMQAVRELEYGKVSFGRDVAGLLFEPGTTAYTLTSGTADAVWVMYNDALNIAGPAVRASRMQRLGLFDNGLVNNKLAQSFDPARLVYLSETNSAVRQAHIDFATAVNRMDERAVVPNLRPAFRPFVEFLETSGKIQNNRVVEEVTREDVVEFFVSNTGLNLIMSGVGMRRGYNGVPVLKPMSNTKGLGRLRQEMLAMRNEMAESVAWRRITDLAEREGFDLRFLDPDFHDGLKMEGMIVPVASLNDSQVGQIGAAAGRSLAWIDRATGGTFGRLFDTMTNLAPKGYVSTTTGEGMDRAISSVGAVLNLPPSLRDKWVRAAMSTGSPALRGRILHAFYDAMFEATGLRNTARGAHLADKYIETYKQAYALGGLDEVAKAGEISEGVIRRTVLPGGIAEHVAVPPLREIIRAVRQDMVYGELAGLVKTGDMVENGMTRFFKPAVLMRMGFVVRNAGEEMLVWMARGTEGSVAQSLGARSLVKHKAYKDAYRRMLEVGQKNLTPDEVRALKWEHTGPGRVVSNIVGAFGSDGAKGQIISGYEAWLRNVIQNGMFPKLGQKIENLDNPMLQTIVRGRRNSWRGALTSGVNPELVHSADSWVRRHGQTVMKAVSANSQSQFAELISSPAEAMRIRVDGEQELSVPLMTLLNDNETYTMADTGRAWAEWHYAQRAVNDPVASVVLNDILPRVFPQTAEFAGDQFAESVELVENLVRILQTQDIPEWERVLVSDLIWVVPDRLRAHIAQFAEMPGYEDVADALTVFLQRYVNEQSTAGTLDSVGSLLGAVANDSRIISEWSDDARAWLALAMRTETAALADGRNFYNLRALEAARTGKPLEDIYAPVRKVYRGVATGINDQTVRQNPDGSLTLYLTPQKHWGSTDLYSDTKYVALATSFDPSLSISYSFGSITSSGSLDGLVYELDYDALEAALSLPKGTFETVTAEPIGLGDIFTRIMDGTYTDDAVVANGLRAGGPDEMAFGVRVDSPLYTSWSRVPEDTAFAETLTDAVADANGNRALYAVTLPPGTWRSMPTNELVVPSSSPYASTLLRNADNFMRRLLVEDNAATFAGELQLTTEAAETLPQLLLTFKPIIGDIVDNASTVPLVPYVENARIALENNVGFSFTNFSETFDTRDLVGGLETLIGNRFWDVFQNLVDQKMATGNFSSRGNAAWQVKPEVISEQVLNYDDVQDAVSQFKTVIIELLDIAKSSYGDEGFALVQRIPVFRLTPNETDSTEVIAETLVQNILEHYLSFAVNASSKEDLMATLGDATDLEFDKIIKLFRSPAVDSTLRIYSVLEGPNGVDKILNKISGLNLGDNQTDIILTQIFGVSDRERILETLSQELRYTGTTLHSELNLGDGFGAAQTTNFANRGLGGYAHTGERMYRDWSEAADEFIGRTFSELMAGPNAGLAGRSEFTSRTLNGEHVVRPYSPTERYVYTPPVDDTNRVATLLMEAESQFDSRDEILDYTVDKLINTFVGRTSQSNLLTETTALELRNALRGYVEELYRHNTSLQLSSLMPNSGSFVPSIAFDDPRLAIWVYEVMTNKFDPTNGGALYQSTVPRWTLAKPGDVHRRFGDAVTLESMGRVGGVYRFETPTAHGWAPVRGPLQPDGSVGVSYPAAVQQWTNQIAQDVYQRIGTGTRVQYKVREADSVFVSDANGVMRPVAVDEPVSAKQQLFNADGDRLSVIDPRYFASQTNADEVGDIKWSLIAPMLMDNMDAAAGERIVAAKSAMDIQTNEVIPDGDFATLTRSRVDDVLRVEESLRPEVVVAPKLVLDGDFLKQNIFDRLVNFTFSRVFGPSIDALIRHPLAFHEYATGLTANYRFVSSMFSEETLTMTLVLTKKWQNSRWFQEALRPFANLPNAEVFVFHKIFADISDYWLREAIAGRVDATTFTETLFKSAQNLDPSDPVAALRESIQIPAGLDLKELAESIFATRSFIDRAEEATAVAAIRNVGKFIDSSEERSVFSLYVRNLIPFHYAEENFFKRWVRTIAETQDFGLSELHRAHLMYNGLREAGIVRTDSNGKDWVVYPGTGLLNKLVLGLFGLDSYGQAQRAPVDQLLPGFNTNAGRPGIGPLGALPVTLLATFFPELHPIKRGLLGDLNANRSVWTQIFPSQFAKFIDPLLTDPEQASIAFVSQLNNVIAMAYARGDVPESDATPEEMQDFMDRMRQHARISLMTNAMFGVLAPVPGAPRLTFVGENGQFVADALNEQFRNYINLYGIEEGTNKFFEDKPYATLGDILNPLALTVSKTETVSGGPLPATAVADEWYTDNEELVTNYGNGAAWFIPGQGFTGTNTYDEYAYSQQFAHKLRERLAPDEFLNAVIFKISARPYFEMKDYYETRIAAVGSDTPEGNQLQFEYDYERNQFMAANPLFSKLLNESNNTPQRQKTIDEIRIITDLPDTFDSPYFEAIKQLSTQYDVYTAARAEWGASRSRYSRMQQEALDTVWADFGERWAIMNPDIEMLWRAVYEPESGL